MNLFGLEISFTSRSNRSRDAETMSRDNETISRREATSQLVDHDKADVVHRVDCHNAMNNLNKRIDDLKDHIDKRLDDVKDFVKQWR